MGPIDPLKNFFQKNPLTPPLSSHTLSHRMEKERVMHFDSEYPFGSPVKFDGTDGYKSIQCPKCEGGNMHINSVFQTPYPDDKVAIRLSCEICPELSDLVINSHKGFLYLGFSASKINDEDLAPSWVKVSS